MGTRSWLKKIPGFRSGNKFKSAIALVGYLFLSLFILGLIIPTPLTLAVKDSESVNQNSATLSGKATAGKPVFLLHNTGVVVQKIKADSDGKFFFQLNNIGDGTYVYTIQVCDSESQENCISKNILLTVDTTPPTSPILELPAQLPDKEGESLIISGTAEPNTQLIVNRDSQPIADTTVGDDGKYEVRTPLVLGVNTIAVTAKDSLGNVSQPTVVTVNFTPAKHRVKVVRVIDGDTIEIEGGQKVRYIGIDTPETVDPNRPIGCYGKEASYKNKELVEGKIVFLEKDVSETDKYERLLRYIWLEDGTLINDYLVKEGYANSSSHPPDVKYQDIFRESERLAREGNKGLWGSVCQTESTPKVQGAQTQSTPQPQSNPTPQLQVQQPTSQPQSNPSGGQQSSGLSNDNYYTNSQGEEVHSPAYSDDGSVPAGATAQCNDGTYSFSQSRSGTCSHHGGVARWF